LGEKRGMKTSAMAFKRRKDKNWKICKKKLSSPAGKLQRKSSERGPIGKILREEKGVIKQ